MHVIPHTYFVQFPTQVKEISWRVHVIDRIDTLNTLARFKYSATLHKYFCIQSFKLPSKYISSRCGKHLSRHSPPRWRPSWHCAYGNAVKYVPSEAIACVLNRIHNTFCVCQSSISSFWQRWQQNGHENWRLYFGMMCRIPKHTRSAHRALPTIIVENQSCMCSTCSTCTSQQGERKLLFLVWYHVNRQYKVILFSFHHLFMSISLWFVWGNVQPLCRGYVQTNLYNLNIILLCEDNSLPASHWLMYANMWIFILKPTNHSGLSEYFIRYFAIKYFKWFIFYTWCVPLIW